MAICSISSLIYSSLISLLYVGSLYCWPNQKHRDDPKTIKRRFVSVSLTIIISTSVLLIFGNNNNEMSITNRLGLIWTKNYLFIEMIWDCILNPLLLTSVLFLGPITLYLTQLNGLLKFNYHYIEYSMNLIVIRNYIIAPITEEFIFRGVLSAFLLNCWSFGWTIVISSVMFGFAHSHHFLSQTYISSEHKRVNAIAALEQMTYTTLFGMYASLLYLKTRFILTPILVHSFCNLMGLPDFEALITSRFAFILTFVGFILWTFSLIYVYIHL